MDLPNAGLYLLLTLWGGLVAVDGTGCGQFMYSRPLVAATLAGLFAGSPLAGVTIGVVLEAFHLMVLPVGAARYPEAGPAAVVAGAMFALSDQRPSLLLAALVFFLAWEKLAGRSVQLFRQVNNRLIAAGAGKPLGPAELQRKHFGALALDFGRGMVLVALGIPLLWLLMLATRTVWAVDERIVQTMLAAVVIGLLSGSLHLFGTKPRLFALGLLSGVVFAWMLL